MVRATNRVLIRIPLRGIPRNCAELLATVLEMQGIVRNCAEFCRIYNARNCAQVKSRCVGNPSYKVLKFKWDSEENQRHRCSKTFKSTQASFVVHVEIATCAWHDRSFEILLTVPFKRLFLQLIFHFNLKFWIPYWTNFASYIDS